MLLGSSVPTNVKVSLSFKECSLVYSSLFYQHAVSTMITVFTGSHAFTAVVSAIIIMHVQSVAPKRSSRPRSTIRTCRSVVGRMYASEASIDDTAGRIEVKKAIGARSAREQVDRVYSANRGKAAGGLNSLGSKLDKVGTKLNRQSLNDLPESGCCFLLRILRRMSLFELVSCATVRKMGTTINRRLDGFPLLHLLSTFVENRFAAGGYSVSFKA